MGARMRSLSVLIIEDEPLIAMMVEDFIDVLGHQVAGAADSVAEGMAAVGRVGFDVAILDVNLRDGACWPVAAALDTPIGRTLPRRSPSIASAPRWRGWPFRRNNSVPLLFCWNIAGT